MNTDLPCFSSLVTHNSYFVSHKNRKAARLGQCLNQVTSDLSIVEEHTLFVAPIVGVELGKLNL